MKESFYFSHDYNAAEDQRIKKLIRIEKMEGYGVYWRIIEMLYQETGKHKIEKDYEGISYDLRMECERIKSVIENYKLFEFDDEYFWSNSVLTRLLTAIGSLDKNHWSLPKLTTALGATAPIEVDIGCTVQSTNGVAPDMSNTKILFSL